MTRRQEPPRTDGHRNAIYIDFEALKTPPAVALLGILTEIDGEQSFEQVVLDERVRGGAVARPHVRVATLADTISRLLATGLRLVGWSVFDRDIVLASELSSELKEQWRDRYINALTIARTWRTKLHPTFTVSRAARTDPKHTLDQYADLAGYPNLKSLRNAQPAKWIRLLINQLAARGHYRRVTRQRKRDWHRVLEYNRHDCLALRHVFLKATFELEKWREYERTTYCIDDQPRRPVCFRVGATTARLDALLEPYGATRWAILTAWNPVSQPLDATENASRQNTLLEQLTKSGYSCLPGEGRGEDPAWRPEESVLALDIPSAVARRFGRDFGQLAIVVGRRGRPARLVACAP